MSVYLALVFCLSTSHVGCIQIPVDDDIAGLAACAIRGQEIATEWLAAHEGWRLDKVRCSLGKPTAKQEDL